MQVCRQNRSGYSFMTGLLTGTALGTGLAIWLVPKAAAEIRGRITDSAGALGARVDDTVEQLTDQVNHLRDDFAEVVVRGARKVGHIAKAAKS